MKSFLVGLLVAGGLVLGGSSRPVQGQTHKVEKTQNVVRAVGVYEWMGDMAKPTASRLIPITVFIDKQLEDAGVYLARPVPFALLTGNVYELQQSGVAKGTLSLAYSRHLHAENLTTGESAYDDGWFGYGSYQPLRAEKKAAVLRASKTLPVIKGGSGKGAADDDRPHFATRGGGDTQAKAGDATGKPAADTKADTTADKTADKTADDTSTGNAPAGDPDRPTLKRRPSSGGGNGGGSSTASSQSGTGTTDSATSTPADDPDRPVMKRRSSTDSSSGDGTAGGSGSAGDSGTSSSGTGTSANSGGVPADDPDRPTLKRHTADQGKKSSKHGEDEARVTGVGSLNDDPNRPNLHRGKPASAMTEADLPKLTGLPVNMHQMVAVSDAVNRPVHDFTRPWEGDQERAAVLKKMEDLAQKQLDAYRAVGAPSAGTADATGSAKTSGTTAAASVNKAKATTASRRAKQSAAHSKTPPAPAGPTFLDEELKGYLLSYGGAPTYIYTAHTDGTGAALIYVTIVAQADAMGEIKPAIQSVTDAAHLDRTPRMKPVDAVDVEASNRASLLFELRQKNARQFALYRVIGAQAEQIFLTGTTQ